MSETLVGEAAREAPGVSERITHAISIRTVFTIDLPGLQIPVSDTVIMTWFVMALIAVGTILATRRLSEVPRGAQTVVEYAVDFLYRFVDENMHHHGKEYAALIGSIFVFLTTANVLPLLTPVGGFGYEPPFLIKPLARDINIAAALAVIVILTTIFAAIRKKGPGGWIRSFVRPYPFMLPFNILEYFIKPTSLSLRLFGNMLGAFIIMQLLEMLVPIGVPPVAAIYFDIFDGALQAVVFTFLSTIYIGEALE